MDFFTPQSAAKWLSDRLGKTVSRPTVQLYIATGDLKATNLNPEGKQARWLIKKEDLEVLAARAEPGRLPIPTGGWPSDYTPKGPENDKRRKKTSGLVAFAN